MRVVKHFTTAEKVKLNRLLGIVVAVLTNEHDNDPDQLGATMNIRNERKHVVFMNRNGNAREDKACDFDFFAAEKTYRLAAWPTHLLSWQSRNKENQQYPGGVRFPSGLLGSISGYKWEEDQAGILWIGVQMGWLTDAEALEYSKISSTVEHFVEFSLKFDKGEHEDSSIM